MKYHGWGVFNNRSGWFHSSADQKSKIRVHVALAPSEGCEGESVPRISLRFWVPGISPSCWICWQSLAYPGLEKHHPGLCLHLHVLFFLWVQISSIYKDINCIGEGPTLHQYDLILTNYTYTHLISK